MQAFGRRASPIFFPTAIVGYCLFCIIIWAKK
jgi:hypothetical protein